MKAYFEYGYVSSSFVGHTRTERFVKNVPGFELHVSSLTRNPYPITRNQ